MRYGGLKPLGESAHKRQRDGESLVANRREGRDDGQLHRARLVRQVRRLGLLGSLRQQLQADVERGLVLDCVQEARASSRAPLEGVRVPVEAGRANVGRRKQIVAVIAGSRRCIVDIHRIHEALAHPHEGGVVRRTARLARRKLPGHVVVRIRVVARLERDCRTARRNGHTLCLAACSPLVAQLGLGSARLENHTEKRRASRPMLSRADERAAIVAHRRRKGAVAHKVRQRHRKRLVSKTGVVIGRAPASALIAERGVGQHRPVAVVGCKRPRR